MNIRDITIAEMRAVKNWRLVPSGEEHWFGSPTEESRSLGQD